MDPPPAHPADPPPPGETDRRLLAFAAEQRIIVAEQAAAILEITVPAAARRLRGLAGRGHLVGERPLNALPVLYRISRGGARAIASELPAPRALDIATCEHELGVGWLALAARRGRFGAVREVVSERIMRSQDRRHGAEAHFGVRIGGHGAAGRERLHYPDLLVITASGHRVAFELELSAKGRTRREAIIGAYAGDARVDAVVYLVRDRRTARAIEESATRVGAADRVHVQLAALTPAGAGAVAGRAVTRRRSAARPRESAR